VTGAGVEPCMQLFSAEVQLGTPWLRHSMQIGRVGAVTSAGVELALDEFASAVTR